MASRIANFIRPAPTPKRKPTKSKDYLAFIHELPCCVTGRYGVEAAHLSFASPRYGHYGRGKGSKASDRWALPLHQAEHRRQHRMNEERFWSSIGIDPHLLALVVHGIWSDLGDDAVAFATAIINQTLADAGALDRGTRHDRYHRRNEAGSHPSNSGLAPIDQRIPNEHRRGAPRRDQCP